MTSTQHANSGRCPFHLPLNLHFIRASVFWREAGSLRFDDLENELCFDSDIGRHACGSSQLPPWHIVSGGRTVRGPGPFRKPRFELFPKTHGRDDEDAC